MERKQIYVIYGSHRLLLRQAVERLQSEMGGGDASELDVRRVDTGEVGADELVAECQALSFFGGTRLVIAENITRYQAAAQKEICEYIKNPNPATVLVMTEVIGDSRSKRRLEGSKMFKACKSAPAAAVAEYEIKSGLSSWVQAEFAKRGLHATKVVVDYLLQWVGTDLDRLSGEITKMCDAAEATGREIDIDLCRSVTTLSSEAEVFDYIGAVIDRDTEKALTLIERLARDDRGAGHLFGLLERQFRLILGAKISTVRGKELAGQLGVSSGQAYYLVKQGRLYSFGALRVALGLLVDVDFSRKSSRVPPRLLIEELTVDLCNLSRASS